VAVGDNVVKITTPLTTLTNDDTLLIELERLISQKDVSEIVVGLPRNNQGEETAQSQYVRDWIEKLLPLRLPVTLQDESLTSVEAERLLQQQDKPYDKAAVDAQAAALILSDFLEQLHG
jgi:putative Holliday junction resolvase